jgi:cystathionine beta-lyase
MSIRLDVPLEELRRRRGAKWTAFGAEVLPAWVADMDFPIARPVEEAILDVLERNDVGYPGEPTVQALASAFSQRMSDRFGWQPDPSRVMSVGDLIQALIASVATFSQPGEGVVVQTPIYHPFLKIVEVFGRRLVDNPLVAGRERYEMDLDHLREVIDDGTRLVLFCNPHNPTGRVFERRELEGFAELALEHDLTVVSDEIHADLVYEGRTHVPLASLGPEIAARTITLTSATKAFNIAGLKCAVIHFGSEEMMARQTRAFPDRLLGIPNIVGIEATLAAWREGGEWLDAVLAQLDANRNEVAGVLAKHLPGVAYRRPEASYFAWLDCSGLGLASRPYEFFLSDARVAFSDGQQFGSQAAQFVRLNFATTPGVLQEILDRTTAAALRAALEPTADLREPVREREQEAGGDDGSNRDPG